MPVTIRPSTMRDAVFIAQNLRPVDKDEIVASNGEDVLTTLIESFQYSRICYTAVHEHTPVAMLGVVQHADPRYLVGIPWLLATPQVGKLAKDILRISPKVVQEFQEEFPLLVNYCDVRNKSSIRWLKWLGFIFTRVIEDFGVAKKPFYEFVRTSNV